MTGTADLFHVADETAILAGETTDVYFRRTLEVLDREGMDPVVLVEVRAGSLPEDRSSKPGSPSSRSRGATAPSRSSRRRSA